MTEPNRHRIADKLQTMKCDLNIFSLSVVWVPSLQSYHFEIFNMSPFLAKTLILLILLHLLGGGQALDFESVGEKIMKKIGKLDLENILDLFLKSMLL